MLADEIAAAPAAGPPAAGAVALPFAELAEFVAAFASPAPAPAPALAFSVEVAPLRSARAAAPVSKVGLVPSAGAAEPWIAWAPGAVEAAGAAVLPTAPEAAVAAAVPAVVVPGVFDEAAFVAPGALAPGVSASASESAAGRLNA